MELNNHIETLIFDLLEEKVCPIDFIKTVRNLGADDSWILRYAIWNLIPDGTLDFDQWKLLSDLPDSDLRRYCEEYVMDLIADEKLEEILK